MCKRTSILLMVSILLLALCCGCQGTKPVESAGTGDAKMLKTDKYSLLLPESMTAKEGENGSQNFFLDGKEIGGITVIEYENAEQMVMDQSNKDVSKEDEEYTERMNKLLNLLAPEGEIDYMSEFLEDSAYSASRTTSARSFSDAFTQESDITI